MVCHQKLNRILLTYLPIPTYLPTYLPTYQFLPTCLPNYQMAIYKYIIYSMVFTTTNVLMGIVIFAMF